MSHTILSNEIKEPIPVTFGEGIEFDCRVFKEDHGKAITARREHNFQREGLREVRMTVSSWVGISIGANHHYVRLEFAGCTINNLDGTPHPKRNTYPNGMPKEADRTEVQVRRPVTQRDIDYAKKWKDGWIPKPGDFERGFWSEQEAIDAGIACFREHFGPGWILVDEFGDDGRGKELARS